MIAQTQKEVEMVVETLRILRANMMKGSRGEDALSDAIALVKERVYFTPDEEEKDGIAQG